MEFTGQRKIDKNRRRIGYEIKNRNKLANKTKEYRKMVFSNVKNRE